MINIVFLYIFFTYICLSILINFEPENRFHEIYMRLLNHADNKFDLNAGASLVSAEVWTSLINNPRCYMYNSDFNQLLNESKLNLCVLI